MESRIPLPDAMLYGGDYNPEQWLDMPEILTQDIELMKKAHINVVSMGIFSWAVLEPREGEFHFEWLKDCIDTLYKNGISVFLATPSGARPKWLSDEYPEVLRVEENRFRNLFGERHNHCYSSPIYREKVRIIDTKLVEQFKDHPGVIAWHISNEFGGECHCPLCQKNFHAWLKKRYGTIASLNKAWNTTFWAHTYQDFDQVESPSSRGEHSLHGLVLDWKRFVTDQTVDFFKWEKESIRNAGSKKPVTTNLMYDYPGLNYHRFADVLDFVSWDNYPYWHHKKETETAADTAMQHDIMRSLQRKPFVLMESCPSSTNWQPISKLKEPGILKAQSLQAVAHGSESVMYFQIRQSRGSAEKFHGAVIDHYGKEDTRVFQEVTSVGEDLGVLREIRNTEVKAKAAVIYDWDNRWALEEAQGPRNEGVFYKEAVLKSHRALSKYGLNVDVVDMTQDIDRYEIVAAPMLYMLKPEFCKRVRDFVASGKTFVMTYWSGIVDETDLCFLGGTPHGLMDVMGLRSEEIDGLYEGTFNTGIPCKNNALGLSLSYRCENICDLVRKDTAEEILTFGRDFYQGKPALTRNSFGKGTAYYVCADFEQKFYNDFYDAILKKANIRPIIPKESREDTLFVTSREKEGKTYIFLQNFERKEAWSKLPEGYECLLGHADGRIGCFETAVWMKKDGTD